MHKFLIFAFCFVSLFYFVFLNSCSQEPKGTAGTFTLSDSVLTGTNTSLTITIKDPDVSESQIPVTVTSSLDAIGITVMLTGTNGVFTGKLYFTTSASNDTAIQVSHNSLVTIKYADKKPAADRIATVIWKGSAGTLTLDKEAYTSIATPMVITVEDVDVSAPNITVSVTTTTYTNPVNVVLLPVSGKYGTYSKSVYFTPETRLTLADTIHVKSGDVVTVTYADQVPPGTVVTKTATWNGVAGTLEIDSTDYHGQATQATINLTDPDLVSTSVDVLVKSKKDTAGITLTLTGSSGKYTGTLKFTMTTSVAKTSIAVSDSDLVTISYQDAEPSGTITKTCNWYSNLVKALGIYGQNATPGSMYKQGFLPKFFNWGPNTCIESEDTNFAKTGTTIKLTAGTMGWAGFGWTQVSDMASTVVSSINMSDFAACSLHVRLKGNATGINILVENATHSGQTWVPASDYGYIGDEQWHEVVIPLSAWAATCDLSGVSYFMGAVFSPYTAGQYIVVDDLYWTLPQTPTTQP